MTNERGKPPFFPSLSAEEQRQWQTQVKDVMPLPTEPKITAPPPAAPKLRRRNPPLPLPTPSAAPPNLIERGLLDRIGKGKEPIEARLDLHGLTEAEAHQHFIAFVHRAYFQDQRTVLVITGKGRASEGKLRRALRHWLESEEVRGMISGYHTARAQHGGEGAWYLRLRQKGSV